MPHGYPDWGGAAPISTVYTLQDLAELAARLGSPVTFHRTGNVIFIENFEGSLSKVITDTGGTGGSITISNETSLHGDFSGKMVTGDKADDYAQLYVRLAYPVLSRIGIEVCWHMPDGSRIYIIELRLELEDGTTRWWPRVRWDVVSDAWQYRAGSQWIPLSPTVSYFEGETQFNHTKLVADFASKKYVRLLANEQTYDLSDIAIPSLAVSANPQLIGKVVTYARVDGCATIFLDNIIITQNEP